MVPDVHASHLREKSYVGAVTIFSHYAPPQLTTVSSRDGKEMITAVHHTLLL
jgi:hypothetical protein